MPGECGPLRSLAPHDRHGLAENLIRLPPPGTHPLRRAPPENAQYFFVQLPLRRLLGRCCSRLLLQVADAPPPSQPARLPVADRLADPFAETRQPLVPHHVHRSSLLHWRLRELLSGLTAAAVRRRCRPLCGRSRCRGRCRPFPLASTPARRPAAAVREGERVDRVRALVACLKKGQGGRS